MEAEAEEENKEAEAEEEKKVAEEPPKEPEWKPTKQWIKTWVSQLPIDPLLLLLRHLSTTLDVISESAKVSNEFKLKESTIVGILPVPHQIVIRKNEATGLAYFGWMSSYIWGLILLKSINPFMFNIERIKLFSLGTDNN